MRSTSPSFHRLRIPPGHLGSGPAGHDRLGSLGHHQLEQKGRGLAVEAVGVVNPDHQPLAAGVLDNRPAHGLQEKERVRLAARPAPDVRHERSERPERYRRLDRRSDQPKDLVTRPLPHFVDRRPGQTGLTHAGIAHQQQTATAAGPKGSAGERQLPLPPDQFSHRPPEPFTW
jgi:hypothetical protein